MSTGPAALADPQGREVLTETAAKARDYIRAAKADATLRAYRSDWKDFSLWCRDRGLAELPAEWLSTLPRLPGTTNPPLCNAGLPRSPGP